MTFGVLLSPLMLLVFITAVNVVSPMGLVFLTSFEIENHTDDTIFVTPIGAVGKDGERRILPYSVSSKLCIMSTKASEFPIPPNSSRRFTYDWDDIQFSEILFRRSPGEYHVMPTGLHPTENQYQRPEKTQFQITDLESTPFADQLHLEALPSGYSKIQIMYILCGLGLASPFLLFAGIR